MCVRGLIATLGLPLLLGACTAPPAAPTELDELSAFLFAHFEPEDGEETVMPDGLGNLRDFCADVDLSGGYADRSYTLEPLSEEDIEGIVHAERDLELQLPIALIAETPHTPFDHSNVMIMEDQTEVEPASANHYVRTFLDPTDPSGFPDQEHMVMRTNCNIYKENTFLSVPYDMHKDFRWFEVGEPGSGEWAVMGRAWTEEAAHGDSGSVHIYQSYSIDVFLPVGSAGIRYMSLWTEVVIPDVSDDIIAGTTKMGMSQMFDATDEYVTENF